MRVIEMKKPGAISKKQNHDHQIREKAEAKLANMTPSQEMAGKKTDELIHELQMHQIELEMQNDELKKAQINLENTNEKYIDLYDFAPVGYFTFSREGLIKEVNLTGAGLLGVTRTKLIDRGFGHFVIPSDFRIWNDHLLLSLLLKDKEKQSCQLRLKREDGSTIFVRLDSVRIEIMDVTLQVRTAVSDITQLKVSEEALRENEARLQSILDNSSTVVFLKDLEGRYIMVNRRYEELFHVTRQTVIGKSDYDIFPREHADRFRQHDLLALEKGGPFEIEEFVPHDDGMHVYISVKFPLFTAEGKPYAVCGIATDITERKRAEAAIRERKERLRQAVRVSQIGIFDHDYRTDTIYWSPEQRHIYGLVHEDPVTMSVYLKHVYPEDSERIAEAVRRAHDPAGDGSFDVEHRIVDRKGSLHWVSTQSLTQFEGEGSSRHPVRTIGAVADITERKNAEERIEASLKEKEILLREIHHRVKNNMQIISSLLGLASGNIKDKKYVDMFRESQDRINSMSLIHEKLYRSKDLAKIELNEYIRDLANSIYQSRGVKPGTIVLNINIENVQLGIDQSIPFGLIINELITNSLKYAFPGDRKGEIKVSLHLIDENTFELIVGDNGIGIPYDVDFRKTESLGLRILTMLVENQLKGKIDLDRSKGTEFNIKFQGK